MCGRFGLTTPAETIAKFFKIANLKSIEPRWNIAPGQAVPVVLKDPSYPERMAQPCHWGLIPFWAKDTKIAYKLINARSETLSEKPSFRAAYRYRRCLLPVSGFYEWARVGKTKKQPYFFKPSDAALFAFAGLWEHWSGPNGEEIRSCSIITTEANSLMEPIHHRMPVILEQDQFDFWLDPKHQRPADLQPLLKPYPSEKMVYYAVSTYVNKAGNEGETCVAPLEG